MGGIQSIKPIASRKAIGEDIVEMKWAFNDSLLIAVTESNQAIFLDSMCHAFNLMHPTDTDYKKQKVLPLKCTRSIGQNSQGLADLSFKIKGTKALFSSMGLPILTNSKYIAVAANDMKSSESQGTYVKLLYFETSSSFYLRGTGFIGDRPLTSKYILNAHLQAGRPLHVAKMLLRVVHDPETWLNSCMQLFNYCIKHSKVIQTHKVPREIWIELFNLTKSRQALEVFQNSISFCIIRMGLKYLSLDMIDEALFLAFQSKLPQLLSACKFHSVKKRNVMVQNLIDFHEERTNPGNPSSLVKAMTQIANFS